MSDKPGRYVIIGNGITGTTAAETIKKQEPAAKVTLIGDEPYPLYNRVALPRFLKGQVAEKRVLMRSVEQHDDRGIDLMLETRVLKVNTVGKTVLLNNNQELPYDGLLIATGGKPNPLDVPGADASGIYSFQTMDDTKDLIERALASRSAVAVGGSYIAYELTEGFRARGLHTTWLIRGDRFLRRVLDTEGGELVDRIARSHGVDVIYGEEVAKVLKDNGVIKGIVTTGGKNIECGMLGAGLGLTLNTGFLRDTPINLGKGIIADQHLSTNVPDIYTGGDVAEFYDSFLGDHNIMGTWNNSQGHGRVAGRNMAGANDVYDDVPHYTTTMFHTTMTAIGMTPETNPRVEGETLVDFEEEIYRRLFFDGEYLVGGVLIGDMKPRRGITKMIKSREPITDRRQFIEEVGS